jgi:hypothetical protein
MAGLVLAVAWGSPGRAPAAETSPGCSGAASGGIEFLCGPHNVEDLARIPGSPLLIGSGGAGAAPAGALYLIDTHARTGVVLTPDLTGKAWDEYGGCPGALDLRTFHPHGIALRRGSANHHLLYVVNHGARESIELFDVDATAAPQLAWVGCVLLPDGASGNAVAPLPDGGFVATQFFDTRRGDWIRQLVGLERTGAAFVWHAKDGFRQICGSVASGDNGIEVSADGRWVFVNLWPENRIVRLSLDGSRKAASIPVDFMPDNLHWGEDGTLLVGGHITSMRLIAGCKRQACPVDWALARLDPATLKVTYLLWEKGSAAFDGVTGALEVDGALWLSTFRGDRVASIRLPLPPLR